MAYAFDEFRNLVSGLGSSVSDRDPVVRYVCALVAELTYYHVPAFEIDNKKRAMVIPCEGYRRIVERGESTNVAAYFQAMEFENAFVVVDRGVVAIGISLNGLLFIGFRGTKFLFDWRTNLRAPLVHVDFRFRVAGPFMRGFSGGRVHQGFAEEAVRISAKIMDAIRDKQIENVDHVFITGHSLGGAVAALSETFIGPKAISTCIFGSPRYCDVSAYYGSHVGPPAPPAQVQRPDDIVPFVPPRRMGYADHPYQFSTAGDPLFDPISDSLWLYFLWRLLLFLGKRFEPHSVECYRRELGHAANAKWADEPLAPYEKLTVKDIESVA